MCAKLRNLGGDDYYGKLGKIQLLTRQEEIALGQKMELDWPRKERQAIKELAVRNLRLVLSIARQYSCQSPSLTFDDLVEEGNLGLLKAINSFDWRRGCKFSTYATPCIHQHIRAALVNQSRTVRIPGVATTNLLKYRRAKSLLSEKLGRAPTENELALALGFSIKKLKSVCQASRQFRPVLSIDTPVREGEEFSLSDSIESRDEEVHTVVHYQQTTDALQHVIAQLAGREREIIMMRFFGGEDCTPLTLEQVGAIFGITRERVRQIESKILWKLRNHKDLMPFNPNLTPA